MKWNKDLTKTDDVRAFLVMELGKAEDKSYIKQLKAKLALLDEKDIAK